jgi:hypothetical protein
MVNVKLLAPLVCNDDLQVAVLSNRRSKFIALAVPDQSENRFVVTSVTPDNLKEYLAEVVDLRYLFTYPHKRSSFYCHIVNFTDKIQLTRHDLQIPEDHLPERGFFSRFHTHDFVEEPVPQGSELLKLDGQWELFDFARFQAKFSDIYAFLAALKNVIDTTIDERVRVGIRGAFLGKPFKGGGSYGSLFSDLSHFVPSVEKLSLRRIKKASPGEMELRGEAKLFDETEVHVNNYLENRSVIEPAYKALHGLLQTNSLLRQDVATFDSNTLIATQILALALSLAEMHKMPNTEEIHTLCGSNALATTKVVLAFHRRVEGAAEFFAQGRVSFAS